MELLNPMNRVRNLDMLDQENHLQEKKPHKRLSQKEERVEEFLKRLEMKLRREDRGFA